MLIEALIAGGHAYESDGDVYFRVADFPSYGALSGQKVDEMQPEEITPKKRAPLDFALWKAQKADEDAAWESPWGPGRPGWHIECSAMSTRWLAETIDLHHGGQDLMFPHHENEIAQSEGAFGGTGDEAVGLEHQLVSVRCGEVGAAIVRICLALGYQHLSEIPRAGRDFDQAFVVCLVATGLGDRAQFLRCLHARRCVGRRWCG